jgi:hypothetical protein
VAALGAGSARTPVGHGPTGSSGRQPEHEVRGAGMSTAARGVRRIAAQEENMLGQLAAVAEAGGPALVGAMATHAWQTTQDTRWPVCSAAADRPCRPLSRPNLTPMPPDVAGRGCRRGSAGFGCDMAAGIGGAAATAPGGRGRAANPGSASVGDPANRPADMGADQHCPQPVHSVRDVQERYLEPPWDLVGFVKLTERARENIS